MTNKSDKYLGNSNLKAAGVNINFSEKQIEEYVKCAADPVYFIKTYVKIISLDKGTVPFVMYDFQEDMVELCHKNRFVISKMPRQSGKSTTVTSYLLHYILFNQSMSVALLANKLSTARELLGRLKMAYEFLPLWLQQGVVEWNKGSIVLENGSKVLASSTSSSAIRGGSFNCISEESIITIMNADGEVTDISIGDFYKLAYSSRNTNKHTYFYENNRQQIQEMVFFFDRECATPNIKRRDIERKTSHRSIIVGGKERKNECGFFNYSGTPNSTSTTSEIFDGGREIENVSRILSNGSRKAGTICENYGFIAENIDDGIFGSEKNNENRNKTFGRNQKKNRIVTLRKNFVGRIKKKNIHSEYGEIGWIKKTERIWGESFSIINRSEKDERTFRQDKQESRKDQKDCRKASWNEKIRRSKGKNANFGHRQNKETWWPVEQRTQEKTFKVLTRNGFKSFRGISKTKNKSTIKLILESGSELVCTEDHLISTYHGFMEAGLISIGSPIVLDGGVSNLKEKQIGKFCDVYDLLDVEDTNAFYANGIEVHNCILLDEFAYVPQNVAEEFFSSVYPTITSGKTTKVIITSTPNGLNMFYKIWVNANKQPNEEGKNEYCPMEVHWSDVPGRDEKWKKQTIANTSEEQFNTEFNCEFLGSLHTLVEPNKIKCLAYRSPIFHNAEGLRIYQKPIPDHKYVLVADTARGQGKDYHAFTVMNVTTFPYSVVATFRNNQLAPMLYPNAIYPVARQYNKAYVLVEINDLGQQVAEILHKELEYDNMVYVQMMGRKGQIVNGGFGGTVGQTQMGVNTSVTVKRIGCSVLKNLIEDSKLIIEDYSIVDELCSFVARGESFEAEDGHHDDLVMTLVLFAWLTTHDYFKDITGSDIRKDLYEEKIKVLEEEMTPFGFIDTGIEETQITDNNGTIWNMENSKNIHNW